MLVRTVFICVACRYDGEGVRAFAATTNRMNDTHLKPVFSDISHSSSKSKQAKTLRKSHLALNESSRDVFTLPSTELFEEFCDVSARIHGKVESHSELIGKCCVQSLMTSLPISIRQTCAEDIVPQFSAEGGIDTFSVKCASGVTVRAKHVVVAIGPGTRPNLPGWLERIRSVSGEEGGAELCGMTALAALPKDMMFHTMDLVELTNRQMPQPCTSGDCLLSAFANRKWRDASSVPSLSGVFSAKRVMIVGGGITSAHLALACCKDYDVTSCMLVSRSELRARQFDLDTAWFSRARNALLADYWDKSPDGKFMLMRFGCILPVTMHAPSLQHAPQPCVRNAVVEAFLATC